ncbi:MAG: type II toxin-antitoxin system VapC family toxin [Rhodospirillaceae bacterium]|nr:type II toxin-antitoxin system VapC family toxin [Rhodospirillaceae bacterium]
MKYLLDTDVMSDVIHDPFGSVGQRISRAGVDNVVTSIVTAAELRFGAIKRQAPGLASRVSLALESIRIVPFESPADVHYARIRSQLERAGEPIGANDLFVAAQAIALDLILVTGNLREFNRIKGLACQNWMAPRRA